MRAPHPWRCLWAFAAITFRLRAVQAFTVPGVAPQTYHPGDDVILTVNALTSASGVVPYDFYYPRFHHCSPTPPGTSPKAVRESLGSILFGDRIYEGPFEGLKMALNSTSCVALCNSTIPAGDVGFVDLRIREQYIQNWLVDGLPAAEIKRDPESGHEFYSMGFQMGTTTADGDLPILHNHYEIRILYHESSRHPNPQYRVVGVLVFPFSKSYENLAQLEACDQVTEPVVLRANTDNEIIYSYRVTWIPSDTPWGTRWDNYLHVFDPKIHWFSLINSVVILIILSVMVGMVLARALHKDIATYNSIDIQEDPQEDFGWKLVHGDVFRKPRRAMWLAIMLGSGAQLLLMVAVTLVFAVLGFLSPSNRGGLLTMMLLCWTCFAGVAGYVSARFYKMFGGENWRMLMLRTALTFPGAIFLLLLGLNVFLVYRNSAAAVPFSALFELMALWFLVSVPLCLIGAYRGFRRPRIVFPVRTNQIPRQIPRQPIYLRAVPVMLMGGILPFGAIFLELYFIMNSIWFHMFYYVFGFLFFVYAILLVTCAQVTILTCYFQLCGEDYRWWWRGFLTPGASAIYVFLYGAIYYFTKLHLTSVVSTILYFGWLSITGLVIFLLTGTVGFIACFVFVKRIYGSIKVD